MITFNQPRPKITSPEMMATPCHGTTVAASLHPPLAVVTKNKKKASVAAARRSLGAGS